MDAAKADNGSTWVGRQSAPVSLYMIFEAAFSKAMLRTTISLERLLLGFGKEAAIPKIINRAAKAPNKANFATLPSLMSISAVQNGR